MAVVPGLLKIATVVTMSHPCSKNSLVVILLVRLPACDCVFLNIASFSWHCAVCCENWCLAMECLPVLLFLYFPMWLKWCQIIHRRVHPVILTSITSLIRTLYLPFVSPWSFLLVSSLWLSALLKGPSKNSFCVILALVWCRRGWYACCLLYF